MAARGGRGGDPNAFGMGGSEGAGGGAKPLRHPLFIGNDRIPRHPDGPLYGQPLPANKSHEHWEGIVGGTYTAAADKAKDVDVAALVPGARVSEAAVGAPRSIRGTVGRGTASKANYSHELLSDALAKHAAELHNFVSTHTVNPKEHPEAVAKLAEAKSIIEGSDTGHHLGAMIATSNGLRRGDALGNNSSLAANEVLTQAATALHKVHKLVYSPEVIQAVGVKAMPSQMQEGVKQPRNGKPGDAAVMDVPTIAKEAKNLPQRSMATKRGETGAQAVIRLARGRGLDTKDQSIIDKLTDFAGMVDRGEVSEDLETAFDNHILTPITPVKQARTPKPAKSDTTPVAAVVREKNAAEQKEIDDIAATRGGEDVDVAAAEGQARSGSGPFGNSLAKRGVPGIGRLEKNRRMDTPKGKGRGVKDPAKIAAEVAGAAADKQAEIAAGDNAVVETVAGTTKKNTRTLAGGSNPAGENREAKKAADKARAAELKNASDKWDAENGVRKEKAPRKPRTGKRESKLTRIRKIGL